MQIFLNSTDLHTDKATGGKTHREMGEQKLRGKEGRGVKKNYVGRNLGRKRLVWLTGPSHI